MGLSKKAYGICLAASILLQTGGALPEASQSGDQVTGNSRSQDRDHNHIQDQDQESSGQSAGQQSEIASELLKAHKLYLLGSEGDKEAVEPAMNVLRGILRRDSGNAEAKALLGATMTLQARDTFWPNDKVKITRKAVALMDEAVAMAPEDPDPRWIRAANNVHFPPFLKRLPMALSDLEILWNISVAEPERFDIDRRQRTGRLYGLAQWKSENHDEARKIWKQAMLLAPDSKESQRINQLQKDLEQPERESKLGPGALRR